MSRLIKIGAVGMFLAFIASTLFSAEDSGSRPFERTFHPLFSVHRSINTNEVIYEAGTTPQGFIVSNPINVYWIMRTQSGAREPLNGIEKGWAYGVNVKAASESEVQFVVKALPERVITVHRIEKDGAYDVYATVEINGEECIIQKIFIQTNGGGIFPSIQFTEITGLTIKDRKPAVERIIAK